MGDAKRRQDLVQQANLIRSTTIPKGKRIIGWIEDELNCVSEKIIMEWTRELEKHGFTSMVIPNFRYKDALDFVVEFVVLFRLGFKTPDAQLVKAINDFRSYIQKQGVKVLYYADDLIFQSNKGAALYLATGCDDIVVATPALKKFLEREIKISTPIHIVPTHIDLFTYDRLDKVKWTTEKYRILFTSSGRVGAMMLHDIVSMINSAPDKYKDVEFIVSSMGVAQMRSLINKYRNVYKTYYEWLPLHQFYSLSKSVDLILAPGEQRDLQFFVPPHLQQMWLDSKSEVKYTLSGAAKIPIIASPAAQYRAAIKHEKTGFLANSPEEFIEYIDLVRDNKNLAKEMGLAAREDVEKNYNLPLRTDQFRQILDRGKEVIFVPTSSSIKRLFIPMITGGPRSFGEMMKRVIPSISNNTVEVTEDLASSDAAIVIAYVAHEDILQEKRTRGIKVIHRIDGLPMTFEGQLDVFQLEDMKTIFASSDHIVWQSEHCQKFWHPHLDTTKGIVIHNGVDKEIFTKDGEKHPFPKDKFNILHVNWSTFKHKRIDLLEEVIRWCSTDPSIHFTLVGQYKDTSVLHDMEKWSEFPNVTYLGPVRDYTESGRSNMANFYRGADILLFTSEMEGSPNTLLEAISCGLPIVSNGDSSIAQELLQGLELTFKNKKEFFEHLDVLRGDASYLPFLKKKVHGRSDEYKDEVCATRYLQLLEWL